MPSKHSPSERKLSKAQKKKRHSTTVFRKITDGFLDLLTRPTNSRVGTISLHNFLYNGLHLHHKKDPGDNQSQRHNLSHPSNKFQNQAMVMEGLALEASVLEAKELEASVLEDLEVLAMARNVPGTLSRTPGRPWDLSDTTSDNLSNFHLGIRLVLEGSEGRATEAQVERAAWEASVMEGWVVKELDPCVR